MKDRLQGVDIRKFLAENFGNTTEAGRIAGVKKSAAWSWVDRGAFPLKDIEGTGRNSIQVLSEQLPDYTALELAMINRPILQKMVADHIAELERREREG